MKSVRRITTGVVGMFCAVWVATARAEAQGIDTLNPGADGYVHAIAVQADGKILLGGDFFKFGCHPNCDGSSVTRNYIGRLNADGTLDASFDPGANGPVYAIVVQPDGRIVIGGNFSTVGGGGEGNTARKYLARLNPDGTVDPGFNPGTNMNNSVLTLALQPDGKIVVGGNFYAGLAGGVRYFFGRLNADGSLDDAFAPGVDGAVYAVALQGDGRILVGGLFTHAGGEFGDTGRNRICRFNTDGSLDMAFNPGAENRVDTITVQADGKILVGGIFDGLGGGTGTTPRFNIGRINPDGIVDQDFIPGADDRVYTFAQQADGRILVGGEFTMLGGGGTGAIARNGIGRLNADGTIDPTFDPGAQGGGIFAIAVQMDGNIVVGGRFLGLGAGGGPAATQRSYVGRILNSEPALQSITVTDGGNTVTWLRNGTSPEVAFVDFAFSTNGVTYTPLGPSGGAGTRLVGGWRVTGANLPVNPNLTIRVRAHYPTGRDGASGSQIVWIVPAADFNTIENGDFTLGLSGWLFFATPDMTYIQYAVTGEVLEFYRNPPAPGTTNQAVAYQQTGVPLSANVPLAAEFDLGNSSTVRKRIAVLLHDSDFSDIAFCTFWLPANTPLTHYRVMTHTTKAILNLTISFYAASAGANGGAYRIDNVALHYAPGGSITETVCDDPLAPAPPGGPDSATLLVNGDFASGSITPGWGLFGEINGSVQGGVFRFTKLAGAPSGVILQPTGQAVAANQLLTAAFDLGNISTDRKRVTVILHDNNFSDLQACTFWLAPGQPLSTYIVRTFATQAWANATLSVYPATVGTVPETLLDNVTLKRTPSASIQGTECLEPGSNWQTMSPEARAALRRSSSASRSASTSLTWVPTASAVTAPHAPPSIGPAGGRIGADPDGGIRLLDFDRTIDLTSATTAQMHVESWLASASARAEVLVSTDGLTWETVAIVDPSEMWTPLHIDLSAYLGSVIRIRFAFEGERPDTWWLRKLTIRR